MGLSLPLEPTGNLAVIKACEPLLVAGAKLRAVFLAGGGAAYGYPEFSGYALSKVATVRAVENLGLEFIRKEFDASVVALAPGAVATDMLASVIADGGSVKTRTDIREPTQFVKRFVTGVLDAAALNGRFIHVRDAISGKDFSTAKSDLFRLRRIE
jgi:NAD(P)-dependent dehydrogenase (short-subunit alcohol dehydrogenase family)